jgi:hypothetical protein
VTNRSELTKPNVRLIKPTQMLTLGFTTESTNQPTTPIVQSEKVDDVSFKNLDQKILNVMKSKSKSPYIFFVSQKYKETASQNPGKLGQMK